MTPDQIHPGHTYEMASGHEWTVLRRDGDLLRVRAPIGGEFNHYASGFARYAVRDITPAPESDQGEKVAQAQNVGASCGDGAADLTADDWLQIEMAAKGCVSGTAQEWPALMVAIAKIRGEPVHPFARAAWLQGFCEGVMAMRRTPPATDAVNAELLDSLKNLVDLVRSVEPGVSERIDRARAAIARAEAVQ